MTSTRAMVVGGGLAASPAKPVGRNELAHCDASAPVVAADSIDGSKVFRPSRYGKGSELDGSKRQPKRERHEASAERALADLGPWLARDAS